MGSSYSVRGVCRAKGEHSTPQVIGKKVSEKNWKVISVRGNNTNKIAPSLFSSMEDLHCSPAMQNGRKWTGKTGSARKVRCLIGKADPQTFSKPQQAQKNLN